MEKYFFPGSKQTKFAHWDVLSIHGHGGVLKKKFLRFFFIYTYLNYSSDYGGLDLEVVVHQNKHENCLL